MPKLVRLYIKNVLIGFAIAAAFVAMLLWFDLANLWTLVSNSSSGPLALFILWFAHGIVFAGVQFAIAVMRMADQPEKGGPARPIRVDLSRPVKVTAPQKR